MLGSQDRPMFGRVLRSLAKQTEWVSWLVFGVWLGRYLFAQDPVALAAGIVSFVLFQVSGVACKLFADKLDKGDEPTDGPQAAKENGEVGVEPTNNDRSS